MAEIFKVIDVVNNRLVGWWMATLMAVVSMVLVTLGEVHVVNAQAKSESAAGDMLAHDTVIMKINDQVYTVGDFKTIYPAQFHKDIELKLFEVLGGLSQKLYLEEFYKNWAKQAKVPESSARQDYLAKKVKVSDKQVAATMEQLKDNPQLQALSAAKRKEVVKESLIQQAQRDVELKLLTDAIKDKKMELMLAEPESPQLDIKYYADDYVRYGPDFDDIKPLGCAGDDCPITIVEYAEFQCPYCAQVPPVSKQILAKYKGKIRWIVRDFPLDFHKRAVPTAIAAGCAGEQDKYWHMYTKLFANQSDLSDQIIVKHAKSLGIYNTEFKDCLAKPDKIKARVDRNFASGVKLGVSGTPGFFLNGKKLMIQMSFDSFKQAIDTELKRLKKS